MSMPISLPCTIQNVNGEKLTFLRIINKDGIEYLEIENEVLPAAGPPMHTHYKQDELMTIKQGKIGTQVLGEVPKYFLQGETVIFKAGTPHKFWNAGKDVLICTGYVSPAHNLVYFLSQIYASTNKNGGQPGIYDAAYLLSRYKSEFGMNEIPAFVQKTIFPIVLFTGNLMGQHKKFEDAPEPVI